MNNTALLEDRNRLRDALVGLLETSDLAKLRKMENAIRAASGQADVKRDSLAAVHALILSFESGT